MDIQYGCMAYHEISKIVKRSYSYCRNICIRYYNSIPTACCNPEYKPEDCDSEGRYIKFKKTRLEQEHIDYLTNADTLQNQIGYSLEMRAADFMRKFPDKKLAPKKLQMLYRKYKIRKKRIKNTKILNDIQRRKIRFQI